MERLFGNDSMLFRVIEKISDFVILNLLWVICCLPIITAGASTTALYYVMLKMVKREEAHVVRMFFSSFRQNLKQGSILTVIFIIAGLMLYIDVNFLAAFHGVLKVLVMGIMMGLLLTILITLIYVFPLLAQFENTIFQMIKNSFMIGMSNPCYTIIVLILDFVPIMLLVMVPYIFYALLPYWLLGGVTLISFINAKIFQKVFEMYR